MTLVEYGDYECPYSRMAFRVIQRLEPQLGGQLRFVFRHLPLTRIHPHALAAAHLAEAAALQGRFWPMHELLFGHQQALTDADLWRYADQLGLDRHRLLPIWMAGPSAAGPGRRRQRPGQRRPWDPDPVHQRPAAPGRLRRGDPGLGPDHRQQER